MRSNVLELEASDKLAVATYDYEDLFENGAISLHLIAATWLIEIGEGIPTIPQLRIAQFRSLSRAKRTLSARI